MADINSILSGGFGQLGNALFPVDPNSGIDPASAAAAQRNAVTLLGLGLLAGKHQQGGFGSAAYNAFQGASQNYQGAMQSAFRNTLLKRQADYEQQNQDRQAKLQQQQDRQNAATTASRVAGALASPQYSQNPASYWDLVKNNPDVQTAIKAAGVQLPQGAAPDYGALTQQLGAFGQTSAAPTAPRDLNLKAVIDPKTGKPILVPETQAIGATPYEKPNDAPAEIQGYNLARSQGYKGTFEDWKGTAGKRGTFSDQSAALLASLASKGVSLPTGMRSKEQQVATLNGLLTKYPNSTPDEIADMIAGGQINFGAAKKETTTAAAQAGRVSIATNELRTFAPLVLQASANVPRGSFVPINKLLQMGESAISDPNLRQLKIGVTSMLNAYDQLAARGGTDMNKRAEAHAMLNSADSPEALSAAIAMFQKEADAAGQAAADATKYHAPGEAPKQSAPVEAINALIANPGLRDQFKAKYGYLPSGF